MGNNNLQDKNKRKIIHIDMDCFYAAVEEKDNPSLKGKPVVVAGPPQSRAVVCTANYEARKFGVRAAIPSSRAARLCPGLIFVYPNFERYKQESREVRRILNQYTDKIEPLSLDEAYLDVTGVEKCQNSATLMAQEIRQKIFQELGLRASAGIAPNKFLAKIASDWKKPNGQFLIRPQDVEGFMPSLPIEKIFGVGKVTAESMHRMGFFTCGDLQKLDLTELKRKFGANRATELYSLSRGIDDREVKTEWQRKSLSVEETFNQDLQTLDEVLLKLPEVYEDFERRLEKGGYAKDIKGWVIKLKYHDFQGITRELASRSTPNIEDFEKLIRAAWQKRGEAIRLLGVGVRLSAQDSSATKGDQSQNQDQLQFAV